MVAAWARGRDEGENRNNTAMLHFTSPVEAHSVSEGPRGGVCRSSAHYRTQPVHSKRRVSTRRLQMRLCLIIYGGRHAPGRTAALSCAYNYVGQFCVPAQTAALIDVPRLNCIDFQHAAGLPFRRFSSACRCRASQSSSDRCAACITHSITIYDFIQ
jgi:hypothetical protein